jgi:hypothetical protein
MKHAFISASIAVSYLLSASFVHASIFSTISLSKSGTGDAILTVHGDPNAPIVLYYGDQASVRAVVGTTNPDGDATLLLNSDNYGVACGHTAYALVNNMVSNHIDWSFSGSGCTPTSTSDSHTDVTFDQQNVTIKVGDTKTFFVNGTGGYSISTSTNPSSVMAIISGNSLSVFGSSFGGSNITVCQANGGCGTLNVAVVDASSAVSTQTAAVSLSTVPMLSSFTVTSDDANVGFAAPGNILTIAFSTNIAMSNVSVSVNGSLIATTGAGTGPYSAHYKLNGSEGSFFPISITYTDLSGRSSTQYFYVGKPASTDASASVTSNATPNVDPGSAKYLFTSLLSTVSRGTEVRELQKKLSSLGFFSGTANGVYGPLTKAAVIKFQSANGITQTGNVGTATRAALNK